MKVLEITSYPPPRAGWGVRVSYLKQEIEAAGGVCDVLNIGQSKELTGHDFVPCFGALDYVVKVFRFRLKGYVIHAHMNADWVKGLMLALIACTISILTCKRPIVTLHAGAKQVYFPADRAGKFYPLLRYIFTVCRYVICNSDGVRDGVATFAIDPAKVKPIPAFSVQYLQYQDAEPAAATKQAIGGRKPVIACYAFFRKIFFIEDAVSALAGVKRTHPDAVLVFLGGTDPENEEAAIYKEACLAHTRELGVEDSVVYAGDLDHDEFLSLLSRADIYLRTPIRDGVSSSVLESLSLKIPVVASENRTRPKGVVTYRNHDIADMVAKINQVLAHPDEIDKVPLPYIEDTVATEIAVIRAAYHDR